MAISIKYIHDMVKFVASKTHHKAQRQSDIDLAAYEASLIVFNELKQQYEVSNTISEYMKPFERTETYSGITSPGTSYNKPSDYNRYLMIYREDNGVDVDVLRDTEWGKRKNHPIKEPSSAYPIARIGSTTINVLPSGTKINMVYWKNPDKPKYVESQSGDFDPANSTNLEWSMDMWPKIGNLILGKLGLNLGENKIIEYSEMQKR